jgi:hypothetical protein
MYGDIAFSVRYWAAKINTFNARNDNYYKGTLTTLQLVVDKYVYHLREIYIFRKLLQIICI